MIGLIDKYRFLLSIIITVILSGCVTQKHFDEYKAVYVLDFVPFTERGFLITPEVFYGEYESMGFIEYHYAPEQTLYTIDMGQNDLIGDQGYPHQTLNAKEYDINEGLEDVYNIAIDLGANALMNFRIDDFINDGVKIDGYVIKGFAIYRIQ